MARIAACRLFLCLIILLGAGAPARADEAAAWAALVT